MRFTSQTVLVIGLSSLLVPVHLAWATLGAGAESLTTDEASFSAKRQTPRITETYTIHELKAGRIAIREYISTGGTIFAVTWSGSVHPDLSGLLGTYFDDFREASQKTRKSRLRRASVAVHGTNVTVEKYGHLRLLGGRAYVSQLFPSGVTLDQIK